MNRLHLAKGFSEMKSDISCTYYRNCDHASKVNKIAKKPCD